MALPYEFTIIKQTTCRWSVVRDRDHLCRVSERALAELGISAEGLCRIAFLDDPKLDLESGGTRWIMKRVQDAPLRRLKCDVAKGERHKKTRGIAQITHFQLEPGGKSVRYESQRRDMECVQEVFESVTFALTACGSIVVFIPHLRLKSTIGMRTLLMDLQERLNPFDNLLNLRPAVELDYSDYKNLTPTNQKYFGFKESHRPRKGFSHMSPRAIAAMYGGIPVKEES